MTSVLVNNYVLVRFLGICPFLGVSKKLNQAFGMGVAVTFVMLMATAATYPIYSYLLEPNGLGYMRTIVFILVIAALVQLVEIILKKYIPALHASLGIYLPLITTNCAVLGVAEINFKQASGFCESVFFSFAAALGFAVALVIFSGIREKLEHADPPRCFRGVALALVTGGLLSLAFMGFSGLVKLPY
jgi:electron transport complex protein RnfA